MLRVVAEHLECFVGVERMAGHEDALRLLDCRPSAERALEALVLAEALQRDVDRALQLLGAAIDDVGEDAAFRRLTDVCRVVCGEERDHGAGGLADDLRDQVERVFRAHAESDEGDVGSLAFGRRADLLHVDLAGNHLVTEPADDLGKDVKPFALLVGD